MPSKEIPGTVPVPRCYGGCTHADCFFACRNSPLTMMTSSGTAKMALAQ